MSAPDDDDTGSRYLTQHLIWLARAIQQGAEVEGYFVWSIVDNYEWNHGMDMPFGLYAVDPEDPTKQRVARQVAEVYATIAQNREISASLQERFPAPQ